MIKLKSLLFEFAGDTPPPPAEYQPGRSESILNADFIKFIQKLENPNNVGWDNSKKLWFPHKSPEGGLPTIGYGHKIKNNSEYIKAKNGLTTQAVLRLLDDDLTDANKRVNEYIYKRYKVHLVLTQKQNEMLTEFAFNLGGLEKFPKFVDSVLRNDWAKVKAEYKRGYSVGVTQHWLTLRNRAFYDRFLS